MHGTIKVHNKQQKHLRVLWNTLVSTAIWKTQERDVFTVLLFDQIYSESQILWIWISYFFNTAQKIFLWRISSVYATKFPDLITFTEEILHRKLNFLCIVGFWVLKSLNLFLWIFTKVSCLWLWCKFSNNWKNLKSFSGVLL